MLRFITQRLKSQSINEVKPVDKERDHCEFPEDMEDCVMGKNEVNLPDSLNDDSHLTRVASISSEDKENAHHDETADSCNEYYCKQCCENQNNECASCLWRKSMKKLIPYQPLPNHTFMDFNQGEKRKYSARKCNHIQLPSLIHHSSNDSSSSDDEIKDLCAKYKCVSSSPTEKKTITATSTMLKYHKRIVCVERVGVPRPSLNLEKMQQKLFKRQRPRLVRIKAVKPYKPSDLGDYVAFKPINVTNANFPTSRLIPVEEPLQTSGCVF
ncbi:uncharacterized protein LOC130656632 [Hydractinia symbiolongicarpus]|uniref:uncharacterized protein LOC130656632 n=1 Tax=Hydractinia symbiolongicarpus TaxID=13093 RepID=UPI00254E548D|nr:uncharacterized protein LOC130656632 [Hydractinia symbiolongicarpus]